jgi:hypothetical protein
MAVFLRKQRDQPVITGRKSSNCGDDDYAVIDGSLVVGRISRQQLPAGFKWRWFLQAFACVPPNIWATGSRDTLEDATAEIVAEYQKALGQR